MAPAPAEEGATRAALWAARRRAASAEAACAAAQRCAFLERVDAMLADTYGLGQLGRGVVHRWLEEMARRPEGLERVRDWILLAVNGNGRAARERRFAAGQLGSPDLVPGLRARPFWQDVLQDLRHEVESWLEPVRTELLRQRRQPVFQPYRAPDWVSPERPAEDGVGSLGHDAGDWNVCYLKLHNVDFTENCQRFPETIRRIKSVPRGYCHAFFSVLAPGTHVAKHHGPTNKKLRIHLPLVVPPGASSGLRVGDQTREFEEGKCLIFDDSFEHEAWNWHPTQSRVCLIVDVWHPDLSDREVTLLKFLEKGKMKQARRVCDAAAADAPPGDNYYALLRHTASLQRPLPT